MSQYEELVQIVEMISSDSELKSYEILQYAESLGRFLQNFTAIVNGTNDASARIVCTAFLTAQKHLYLAGKATFEAAQAGYDWCGDSPKELVLKKVR
jgi:hypothetical protein